MSDLLKRAVRRLDEPKEDVMERLMDRIGTAAEIAYGEVETPCGTFVVAATGRGLVSLSFERDPEHVTRILADRLSPSIVHAPKLVDPIRRELDEYFEGKRTKFDMALDWSLV